MPRLNDHDERHRLNNEVHARPYQLLAAPMRISHLALISSAPERDRACLAALCDRFGVLHPGSEDNFFSTDFPMFQLRWERHTEFSTFTVFEQVRDAEPFSGSALQQLPEEWVESLPGQVLVALNLELLPSDIAERPLPELAQLFSSNTVAGSEVSGGDALVWTDHRIHADGFGRLLIHDRDLRQRQAGRLVQRLIEIETYRMLALRGLPLARHYSVELADWDERLARVTEQMAGERTHADDRQLLGDLSSIAARVEHIAASTGYRFSATRAYYELVQQRIAELREQRIEGLQTFHEFMERRLAPAAHTCESVQERVQTLSNRVARVSDLLRTRVDITLEAQNRDLLRSMNRRAAVQLRLQEMVEGLSVVVLGYYCVGLIGYLLKGIKRGGVALDIDLAMAVAVPVVILLVFLGLRFSRRRLKRQLESSE